MVTGNCLPIEERPLGTHADIIYLSTDLVRCDDGSLAAIGVCALKRIIQLDETLTNVSSHCLFISFFTTSIITVIVSYPLFHE